MAEQAFDVDVVVALVAMTCGDCGTAYGISRRYYDECVRDHSKHFHCPRGCRRHFVGKTEAERLKDQLDCEQRETARLRGERDRKDRQLSAARGRITKIKNRVGRGVCPCCNRTFVNLGRHMQGQHPGFTDQDVGP